MIVGKDDFEVVPVAYLVEYLRDRCISRAYIAIFVEDRYDNRNQAAFIGRWHYWSFSNVHTEFLITVVVVRSYVVRHSNHALYSIVGHCHAVICAAKACPLQMR
jgi:hypothetical protein